jgi:hypothetical protein
MWTLCPENVDQIQRPSYLSTKTMTTVFFNGTGPHMIEILRQNQKMNAKSFALQRPCYTIIGFDLVPNSKELPKEKMRCSF